jgi:translation initiation factor IF-3
MHAVRHLNCYGNKLVYWRKEFLNTSYRPGFRGGRPPFRPQETHRINHQISAREVRLVAEDGEQLGVLPIKDALKKAEEAELDLVEVAPTAKPPVCKLLDYGKFKYKEQKKEAEAKKKRSEQSLKELRIRYRTDVGDLETKLKKAREFLAEGDKVKFSMRFRGREIMYLDLGREKFENIIQRLADVSTLDEKALGNARQIHIVLAPAKQAPSSK